MPSPDPAVLPTIPYDRDAFYQKLSEVEGRLGELYYIDQGTAYLAQVSLPGPPPGNVNVPAHRPTAVSIELSFGQTVPFTRTYWIPTEPGSFSLTSNVDVAMAHLDRLAEGALGWAFCNIESLKNRVAPVTYLSAESLADPVHRLQTIHDTLSDDIHNNLGNLGDSIVDWEGDAASNFNKYVHAKFPDLLASHQAFVEALAGGLVTLKAVVEAAQHSLMNAVHYTSDRLHQQLLLRSLESSGDDAGAAITLLGVGASVLATAISGSGLWGIGMEAVAAGLTAASTAIPSDAGVTFTLFGATAEEILNSLDDATGQTVRNLDKHYDELSDDVRTVLDRVRGLRDDDDGTLVPVRPVLLDGVTAETFRLPAG